MATVYRVTKYVNEWQMDKTGKKALCQVGSVGIGETIAYSKTVQGAVAFLNGYMDQEMDLRALREDKLTKSKKSGYPKRQIDYDCYNDSGRIRHRISLAITMANTILADCLW